MTIWHQQKIWVFFFEYGPLQDPCERELSADNESSLKTISLLDWINDQTLPLIQTWMKILWWRCYASPPQRLTSLTGWPLTEKKTVHHTRLWKYFNEKKMVFQLWIRLVFVKRSPDSGIAGQVSEVGLAGLFVAWGIVAGESFSVMDTWHSSYYLSHPDEMQRIKRVGRWLDSFSQFTCKIFGVPSLSWSKTWIK